MIRLKSYEDGAELAPNASAILNLVRLGQLLGDEDYLERARRSIEYFRGAVDRLPTLAARFLLAESMLDESPPQIVIAGPHGRADTTALIAIARRGSARANVIALIDPARRDGFLTTRHPKLGHFEMLNGQATAHVCKNFTCEAPTDDPDTLRKQLGLGG